ncbi:MAG TPA: restriction endonuclease, partial [Longimicrobium sp.]|nr:restriction endonuclease [Longimicrobium sp.]
MEDPNRKVQTPLFPTYSEVRHLLRVFEGVPKQAVTRMIQDEYAQAGTPQNQVDWSEPDVWIPLRLTGMSAQLAARVWNETGHAVNPRHIYGAYLFINTFELLRPDSEGAYRLTARGKAFLEGDPRTIHNLDDAEGMGELLALLATKGRAMRGDLLPDWGLFLRDHSNFGTLSTTKDTLRRRLLNLVERGLVERDGNSYQITQSGLEYAATFGTRTSLAGPDPRTEVIRAVGSYNDAQIALLRDRLGVIAPYAFEHLVRDLLEEMGYEDVRVTKQSGDKGIDVVATVQFGITTITEVVQVKRHKGSIGRPVLDQLRGALPYFKALRGTIITLGTFTQGCKEVAIYPGAAPISLIDGDKLVELLVKHEVGIQKRQVSLMEIDESAFQLDEAAD